MAQDTSFYYSVVTALLQTSLENREFFKIMESLHDIDTISNNLARLFLAFKIIGLLLYGLWMNIANCDKIPPTVLAKLKLGMIMCFIGAFHFCVVCYVSKKVTAFLTLILTILFGIFEGFYFWIILV